MPIDASIPLQVRQPEPVNLLAQYAQVAGIQNAGMQNKLAQVQYENALRQQQDDIATQDAFRGAGNDLTGARNALMAKGLYKPALALDEAERKRRLENAQVDEKTVKTAKERMDAFANLLIPLATDPQPSYDKVMETGRRAQAMGLLQPGGWEDKVPKNAMELPAFIKSLVLSTEQGQKGLAMLLPKINLQDTGGAVTPFNTNTLAGAVGPLAGAAPVAKTATPGELMTDARTRSEGAANRGQAERHFQSNMNAPQYMETDAGLVALPKRLGQGQAPVGTPVTGSNGEPLGKPLKPLPPAVNDAIIGNAQSLYTLDKAIKLIEGKNVDSSKGDEAATGWKGYVPQAILNRVDPAGVDTRAEIADIGSLKIHDRSGAAVTISESPRLMPFIPQVNDPPAVVKRKLTRLKEEAQRMQQALSDTYSKEQGYRPSPVRSSAPPPPPSPDEVNAALNKYAPPK